MKTLLLLFILLCTPAFAQEDCDKHEDPAAKLTAKVQDPVIQKLAANDKDYQIKLVTSVPHHESTTTVDYHFHQELKLMPGECVYLNVPSHLRKLPVMFMILKHRQDDSENTGREPGSKYDKNPGLSTVQVNETNSAGESKWRYWGGSASGSYGAKFAEPRSQWDIEPEGLYEWYKNGHSDIKTNTASTDILNINGMRVCSIGKDPVRVGGLLAKFYPGKPEEVVEHNFGEGNKMGDTLTASGREYGELKGSIVFNSYDGNSKLPIGWKMEGDRLSIPLTPGKTLRTFEAAVSDTKSSTLAEHDDGEQTTSGWAKLSVSIQKKDGRVIPIMKRENVPPRGVIFGTPEEEVKAEAGDQLIISGQYDKMYLMGLKLGLDKK